MEKKEQVSSVFLAHKFDTAGSRALMQDSSACKEMADTYFGKGLQRSWISEKLLICGMGTSSQWIAKHFEYGGKLSLFQEGALCTFGLG